MIGRDRQLRPYEAINWARAQASSLKPTTAHLLLVLATYADRDGKCYPSRERLAADLGNVGQSTVSRSMAELEEARLVWTVKGSTGRTSTRELLVTDGPPESGAQTLCALTSESPELSPVTHQHPMTIHSSTPTSRNPDEHPEDEVSPVRPHTTTPAKTTGPRRLNVLELVETAPSRRGRRRPPPSEEDERRHAGA